MTFLGLLTSTDQQRQGIVEKYLSSVRGRIIISFADRFGGVEDFEQYAGKVLHDEYNARPTNSSELNAVINAVRERARERAAEAIIKSNESGLILEMRSRMARMLSISDPDKLILLKKIGHGGIGDVYEGLKDGERVAIKICRDPINTHLLRLDDETEMHLRKVSNETPELVGYQGQIDINDDGEKKVGNICELVQGAVSFSSHLAKLRRDQEAMPTWTEVLNGPFRASIRAIAKMHQVGLMHGDMGWENVYITTNGKSIVGDYDITRYSRLGFVPLNPELTPGNTNYMAHDRLDGMMSPSGDIFSLGMMLHRIGINGGIDDGEYVKRMMNPERFHKKMNVGITVITDLAKRLAHPKIDCRPKSEEIEPILNEVVARLAPSVKQAPIFAGLLD